jgi:hypothetical protein
MIGALGCVGACAAVLGIENPSEPKAMGDGEAAQPDASEAGDVVGPDVDAAAGADAREGEADVSDGAANGDVAESAFIGVPCGTERCMPGVVCCYQDAAHALGCMTSENCANMHQKLVFCDGNEDCGDLVCCGRFDSTVAGLFSVQCLTPEDCANGVAVCHVGTATCDCKAPATQCLPVMTCDGRCS